MSQPHNAPALEIVLNGFGDLLGGVSATQWEAPTPCPDWNVRALVNHVVMGQHVFIAALHGQDRPDVTADYLGSDPVGAFRQSTETLLTAFDLDGVMSKTIKVPFGEIPGFGAMHLRTIEGLVHGWDLAQATGQSTSFPEELAGTELVFAQNAIGAVPREGRFGDEKSAAPDAPALEHLAALLGRVV
jgi:uncharacterized protein (TIGR03086 family)